MLAEYQELIPQIKAENARFAALISKHAELDKKIEDADEGREHVEAAELDILKKEKLKLKDEAYTIVTEYKKAKGL